MHNVTCAMLPTYLIIYKCLLSKTSKKTIPLRCGIDLYQN